MSGAFSAIVGGASAAISQLARLPFAQNYQICPIFLSGGIASGVSGGLLPITALTQPLPPLSLIPLPEDYFAQFSPMPGSTLIENELGRYPFANQSVAANAIIAQPLRISMMMDCPVREVGGYAQKLAIITGLQSALASHSAKGGTFTIATPSFIYTSAILLRLADASTSETHQTQVRWQWDFEIPLTTLAQAQMALNQQMQKISSGVPTNGASSGPQVPVGNINSNTQTYTGGMAT
jgi:hypothetical protein